MTKRVVLKYAWPTSPIADRAEFSVPLGAKVIRVAAQRGIPCIWMLCDASEHIRGYERRSFRLYGTGMEFSSPAPIDPADATGPQADLVHVGSFMITDGRFVGHIFEEREVPRG